jgi:hypothetical protein
VGQGLEQRPSPLAFWYRQSAEPLVATTFHTDLLTPGIVDRADPPPISSDMIQVNVDHQGRLTFFEAIPPQRQSSPGARSRGGLDAALSIGRSRSSTLQACRSRVDVAGRHPILAPRGRANGPESGRPLRVEAAGLGGRPVAFMLIGDWQKPWRMADVTSSETTAYLVLLLGVTVVILAGAAILARRNIREGRGRSAWCGPAGWVHERLS